jgi:LmbE family N-acetylglucosaminyl deacetylase
VSLAPFPDDWERALAVVAHPDDLEYGAAGAIAAWTASGRSVVYVLATSGEAGIDGIEPERCGPLREDEQRAAAAVVGVDVVEFLGHPDGVLEYGVPLRRDIAGAIRRHRPDVVVTLNHHDGWGPGSWNTADHRNLGRAVLDATADAANRWIFPDVGPAPWRARWVAVAASPHATHAVDIGATFDLAVASLEAHAAYLAGLGGAMADARGFLEPRARSTGEQFGVDLATAFELVAF